MRRHPALGYEILKGIAFLERARLIPLHHQERFDGTGYPAGPQGRGDSASARASSPWSTPTTPSRATGPTASAAPTRSRAQEIQKFSGTQFDPAVVASWLRITQAEWDAIREEPRRPRARSPAQASRASYSQQVFEARARAAAACTCSRIRACGRAWRAGSRGGAPRPSRRRARGAAAKAGAASTVGRLSARPSAAVNSPFVTGSGATALRTPETDSVAMTWRSRPISSSMWIHGIHCLPVPTRPPTPRRNGVRTVPEESARAREHEPVADDDDAHAELGGLLRLGLPFARDLGQEARAGRRRLREDVVASVAVGADARGLNEQARAARPGARSASTRARVVATRLSRRTRLRSSDQRLPPIDSPARLTTTSTPSSASAGGAPFVPSHA